jgi:hypothetical protein
MDAMMAGDLLEATVWHMDEPVANHIQTSTYALAKFAKPEITVASVGRLSGGRQTKLAVGGRLSFWHGGEYL